ncbi:MAG: YjgN family protein [Pseudomonadota bacterium]
MSGTREIQVLTAKGLRLPEPADGAPPPALAYRGETNDIASLILETILFNLATLTLYRFWARTRVRRYLWSRTEIAGDPLEYTGRGTEMLLGFLIILFIVFLPLAALALVLQLIEPMLVAAIYPIPLFLLGVALYRARGYRLSRTLWRSVRFGQTGKSLSYAWKVFGYSILTTITFGLMTPTKQSALYRYEMNNTWFGDRKFEYAGGPNPLYGPYIAAWFARIALSVVVFPLAVGVTAFFAWVFGDQLGLFRWIEQIGPNLSAAAGVGIAALLYLVFGAAFAAAQAPMAWYYAAQFNHFARWTRVGDLGFEMSASGWSVAKLVVGNAFIMLFTLGLGRPFTQVRTFRYVADRLVFRGVADFEGVGPSTVTRPGAGEGLADALDVGAV